MQSKRGSLIEAVVNVAFGIAVAWGATWLVFPWFGYEATWSATLGITLIFTVVSLVRSYLIRRLFVRFEANSSPSLRQHDR
jgi:uncharacterized membrane protein (DUF485 family)